jgi:hypothetical protein
MLLALIAFMLSGCIAPGAGGIQDSTGKSVIAFAHVNLVPMTSDVVQYDQTVLIQGDRIIGLGPSVEIPIPENATIIQGEGTFLMPGLADMHIHTRQNWESEVWPVSPLLLYLANGVTVIRDFGPEQSNPTYVLRWREEIEAGARIGPTIYASGKMLYASPLGDPSEMVHENFTLGFDFLKLYSYISREDFQQALTAANDLGMYSAGHVPYAVGLEMALAEGMNEIAHVEELAFEFIEFDQDKQLSPEDWLAYLIGRAIQQFDVSSGFIEDDFNRQHGSTRDWILDQLDSAGVAVCTTMIIDDTIQLKLAQPHEFLERPENRYLPERYLDLFRRGQERHQRQLGGNQDLVAFKYGLDRWMLAGLHGAGIPLLLGTDSGTGTMGIVPGFSIHDELRILVENGFSPYEAIATGTVNASEVIEQMVGVGDFGTIEVGNRADLLLVARNPLEDVGAIRDLLGVMASGRWYARQALDQMLSLE